jgi:hypothetical protein
LTTALAGSKWQASRLGHLSAQKEPPVPVGQDKKNKDRAGNQISAVKLVGYLLHSLGIRVLVLTFYKTARTKALTEVEIKIVILLNVIPCNLVHMHTHQPFGEIW